jgi:DNA-binding NtrC family response regulator
MNPPPGAPCVVAAVGRNVRRRIRAILPDSELRFVETGAELLRALDENACDLLIIGLHFDQSSAVQALQRVLARDETFPVVCVRGLPFSLLGHSSLEAARLALSELGAHNFIDLLEYPDDALGNERVRTMLERLLPRRSGATSCASR